MCVWPQDAVLSCRLEVPEREEPGATLAPTEASKQPQKPMSGTAQKEHERPPKKESRSGRGRDDRLPAKRPRDEDARRREDYYRGDRSQSARGRGGREFVRGRGNRSRATYSATRGRGSSRREDYRGGSEPRPRFAEDTQDVNGPVDIYPADSEHSDFEDSRRRACGEDSDVSIDENSASVSEASSEKVGSEPRQIPPAGRSAQDGPEAAAAAEAKLETPKVSYREKLTGKADTPPDSRETKRGEARGERGERRERSSRNARGNRENRYRGNEQKGGRSDRREPKEPRDPNQGGSGRDRPPREDRRERRGDERRREDGPREDRRNSARSNVSGQRGEGSSRGRGRASSRGRGGGGGGGGRHDSAPAPKMSGGFGKPPPKDAEAEGDDQFQYDDREYRDDRPK